MRLFKNLKSNYIYKYIRFFFKSQNLILYLYNIFLIKKNII
jgi:hypothetical protein